MKAKWITTYQPIFLGGGGGRRLINSGKSTWLFILREKWHWVQEAYSRLRLSRTSWAAGRWWPCQHCRWVEACRRCVGCSSHRHVCWDCGCWGAQSGKPLGLLSLPSVPLVPLNMRPLDNTAWHGVHDQQHRHALPWAMAGMAAGEGRSVRAWLTWPPCPGQPGLTWGGRGCGWLGQARPGQGSGPWLCKRHGTSRMSPGLSVQGQKSFEKQGPNSHGECAVMLGLAPKLPSPSDQC